jgi:hypothetical protein
LPLSNSLTAPKSFDLQVADPLSRISLSNMPKDKPSTSGKSQANKKTGHRSAISDVVAREYTIHLHKRVR